MPDDTYAGNQSYASGASDYNQLEFVVRSILGRQATATLVMVKAVTNNGDVSPVGVIDVQPMVAQLDGKGRATPHGIIHNVPYLRVQGGKNAVIIDPVVGDIGICVFGSHDLSSVKATKAPANPGSRRRFSMADALYIGGVLNASPERYIRFDSDGNIELKPAETVTITGKLHVTDEATFDATVTADGEVTGNGVALSTHTHSGVQTGSGDTGPPV